MRTWFDSMRKHQEKIMIQMDEAISMLVGDPAADSEHLELILLINLIYTYSISEIYRTAIPGLTVLFTAKLVSHCQSEEKMLEKLGYNGLEKHKQEHAWLINRTVPMLENTSLDVVKQFESCLKQHIRDYDIPSFKK